MKSKIILILLSAIVGAAIAGALIYFVPKMETSPVQKELEELPVKVDIKVISPTSEEIVNIKRPDVLIMSHRLSQLPHDIMKNPIMKEALSEDFLFYYENSADKLSLEGTVRRIIYEHELDLPANLIQKALNAPAEIAFWKEGGSKLKKYILAVEKTAVSNLMTLALRIVKKDRALRRYKTLDFGAAKKLEIFRLRYGQGKALYFTETDDHYFFFSGTSMIKKSLLENIVFRKTKDGIFSTVYNMKGSAGKHSIVLSAKYLSFNYQRFFPSLEALAFFHDGLKWETWALTDTTPKIKGSYLNSADIWPAVPGTPAVCSALPVEPVLMKNVLDYFMQKENSNQTVLDSITSATIVCWYADSQLFTPLIIARADGLMNHKKYLKKVFDFTISGSRPKGKGPELDTQFGFGFQKSVYGYGDNTHTVSLAYWKNYLLFSPDGKLVENAIATINKKNITLADQIPAEEPNISLALSPSHLADLLRNTIIETLNTHHEELFMEGLSARLFPVFDRMHDLPMVTLSMPKGNETDNAYWEKLKWYQKERRH